MGFAKKKWKWNLKTTNCKIHCKLNYTIWREREREFSFKKKNHLKDVLRISSNKKCYKCKILCAFFIFVDYRLYFEHSTQVHYVKMCKIVPFSSQNAHD